VSINLHFPALAVPQKCAIREKSREHPPLSAFGMGRMRAAVNFMSVSTGVLLTLLISKLMLNMGVSSLRGQQLQWEM
jgi:hypothetical protein